jgi:8-oxo-dGTP pyrophosphatase MutT (NUDIX family)
MLSSYANTGVENSIVDLQPAMYLMEERLREALKKLPGKEAQYQMAPALRRQAEKANYEPDQPFTGRQSAVLSVLYPAIDQNDGGLHLHTILMKRAEKIGPHAGQISLPGGREEPDDPDLMATALRETEEEIGIDRNSLQVLGKLTELFVPASMNNIHPYVAWSPQLPTLKPDSKEVAELFHPLLLDFFAEQNKKEKDIKVFTGAKIRAPYYDLQGEAVWGATAMIMSELEIVLRKLS